MAQSVEQQIAEEIVVFLNPDGSPFSNDPRFNDRAVREAWEARQAGEEAVEEDEDDDLIPYEDMTNDQLRAELSERKLSVDGKKADMIARLEADDQKNA